MKSLNPKHFLFFLLPLCIFLTFNKHAHDKKGSYHGVIWADAAGYYVHLPIWFVYRNDAKAFPDNITEQTGHGFRIDSLNNKIITKYYCGTAMMMSPFFLTAHVLAEPLGFEADGFSKIYSYSLYFSGIVYCCLGLFLLSVFLQKHFSTSIALLSSFILFISTNLFYYAIDAPGMSHIYSFFLVSLFLYSTQKLLGEEKLIYYIFFFLAFVLAVLTRPTNAIIILFPLFYENGAFVKRSRVLVKNSLKVAISIVLGILCLLPQLFYFKSISGSYFTYPYGQETFSNLGHPHILETWFSPNNGLFIYAPVLLLSVLGIFMMIREKNKFGYYLAGIFLLMSYLFASWWNWWFGCSFGARSFVDFYPILSIAMAWCIQRIWPQRNTRYFLFGFVIICSVMYFNIEYYYDGCFYGDTWDFKAFIKLLQ
ncbi:MAG: hypothetical protein K0Q95_806 [Bacteroidota bacterium]|jgi:hypothetical protein|nr:hypothetical protein [Bacteroidota bacterium]